MSDPSPQRFIALLEPALRQAAAIARALEGRVANRPKRGEASPAKAALTVADTASQEALLVPLLEDFAAARLEAEEDTPSVSRFTGSDQDLRIVVDPIDGTLRFYLEGLGPYAVMAGLAVAGRYEAAMVALPREGLFFQARRGGGALCAEGDAAFEPARTHPEGRGVLVSHGLPESVRQRLLECGYEIRAGSGGAIALAPLVPGFRAGLRLAAAGSSISRQGRIGALVAAEAGALVRDAAGQTFPDAIDAPVSSLLTAASPEALEELRDALG